jgi:hypothetical protein
MYINKLKEENKRMSELVEKIQKEREEMRTKLTYSEQMSSETINREKEENEKNKNKLFIIENAIIKKDNIITGLKKKLERMTDNDDMKFNQFYEKEIYVIEPTVAVTQMQDELLLYKQIYENLTTHIKENKESMMKYDALVNELQNDNAKLRTQIKLQQYTIAREKEKEMLSNNYRTGEGDNALTPKTRDRMDRVDRMDKNNERAETDYTGGKTPKKSPHNNHNNHDEGGKLPIAVIDLNKLRNKMKVSDMDYNTYAGENAGRHHLQDQNPEEWIEILRHSGLTPEELDRMGKNKMMSRIIEAIEMLNRLLIDKNLQIRLLEQENENLNTKNFSLNKENISLFQQNIELKKELQKTLDSMLNYKGGLKDSKKKKNVDSSMVCINIYFNIIFIILIILDKQYFENNNKQSEYKFTSFGIRKR